MKKTASVKAKNNEGNFLSQLMFVEQRKHERFSSNLPCKIHYFKNGIQDRGNMEARLINISAGGALIHPRFMLRRDIHLYLLLDNYPFKITAAIVDITKNVHHLKFARVLPEDDVQLISVGAPYQAVLNWKNPKKYDLILSKAVVNMSLKTKKRAFQKNIHFLLASSL